MPKQQIPETEYVALLEHERHMYAWCLQRYAGATPEQAKAQAEAFYRYEPATSETRGLLFHDRAWHWAMKHVFGSSVWRDRPELREPSGEYRAEDEQAG